MSRIIRALETRERPLIACRINVQDKRKIDVVLTPAGRAAFLEHQTARVRAIAGMLEKLSPDDREQLHLLLTRIGEALDLPQHHPV
jgi:DNA-binding MarR family transcriptional regulator